MCLLPGLSFGENPRIAELTRSKQEKMERLQKCEGTTKALKIAGLSTIGLTAVGVVGNVVESQKIKEYQGQSNALDTQISQTKKEIEDKKAEIEKKKAAAAAAPATPKEPAKTPTTPTAANPENTLGDTVCNIKCDESYKDKTIVCKTDNKYASYKCSDNKWTKDNVRTCNDRMIADSTYTKIEQYDGTANTYLFSLPNKSKINSTNAYWSADVCYACEWWTQQNGTYIYKNGKCEKTTYAQTCDTNKKAGDDCKEIKPHAQSATCQDKGAESNGTDILTCYATECASGYGPYHGNCSESGLAAQNMDKAGTSFACWYFNGNCYDGSETTEDASSCGDFTAKGQWKVEFDYGTVRGVASCNSNSGTSSVTKKAANEMSATAGNGDGDKYCWCRVTKFKPKEKTESNMTFLSWVYYKDCETKDVCESYCTSLCADVDSQLDFRKAMFGVPQ